MSSNAVEKTTPKKRSHASAKSDEDGAVQKKVQKTKSKAEETLQEAIEVKEEAAEDDG